MDDLKVMIESARVGDVNAYGMIVRRFQDMAAGYAYSLLHDFQLAEDAAQEAFVEAYRTLAQLREPGCVSGLAAADRLQTVRSIDPRKRDSSRRDRIGAWDCRTGARPVGGSGGSRDE